MKQDYSDTSSFQKQAKLAKLNVLKCDKTSKALILILGIVAVGGISFDMGIRYGYSQAELDNLKNRWTFEDVLVVERHDAQNFTLQPARMQPWQAHTCTPVDWQAGEKMIKLHYQQNNGCKDVVQRGWYIFYTEGGKRTLFTKELTENVY